MSYLTCLDAIRKWRSVYVRSCLKTSISKWRVIVSFCTSFNAVEAVSCFNTMICVLNTSHVAGAGDNLADISIDFLSVSFWRRTCGSPSRDRARNLLQVYHDVRFVGPALLPVVSWEYADRKLCGRHHVWKVFTAQLQVLEGWAGELGPNDIWYIRSEWQQSRYLIRPDFYVVDFAFPGNHKRA